MKTMLFIFLLIGAGSVANAKLEYKVRVVKKGVSGSTTRPAMKRLKKLLDSEKPYMVVILFGMNDAVNIKKVVPIPEFKRNMDALVKYCLSKQVKPVVLTVNPVIEAPLYSRHDKSFYLSKGGANEIIKRYNAAIVAMAKENGIDYIDFHKAVEKAGGATLSTESPIAPDGLHPSYKGRKLLAGLVAEYIKKNYKENGTVLCFGDSITYQGYPYLISKILNAPQSNTPLCADVHVELPEPSGKIVFSDDFEDMTKTRSKWKIAKCTVPYVRISKGKLILPILGKIKSWQTLISKKSFNVPFTVVVEYGWTTGATQPSGGLMVWDKNFRRGHVTVGMRNSINPRAYRLGVAVNNKKLTDSETDVDTGGTIRIDFYTDGNVDFSVLKNGKWSWMETCSGFNRKTLNIVLGAIPIGSKSKATLWFDNLKVFQGITPKSNEKIK